MTEGWLHVPPLGPLRSTLAILHTFGMRLTWSKPPPLQQQAFDLRTPSQEAKKSKQITGVSSSSAHIPPVDLCFYFVFPPSSPCPIYSLIFGSQWITWLTQSIISHLVAAAG